MVNMVLLAALLMAPPRASWTKLVEFSVPDADGAVFRPVGETAGLFKISSKGVPERAFRWVGGRILPLPGVPLENGDFDVGAGLVTTSSPVGGNRIVLTTYGVLSGKALSRFEVSKWGWYQRYGHTLQITERSSDKVGAVEKPRRLVDVTTGEPTSETGMGTLAYSKGAWIGFGRRKSHSPPPAPYNGYLQRWEADSRVRETPVGKYDQTYGGIVGSPNGPFAIPYEPVGDAHGDSDLITRDFRTLPIRPEMAYDASDRGFLVAALNGFNPTNASADHRKFDLLCLDAKTGRILWRLPNPLPYQGPRWCGAYVIWGREKEGYEIFDGRNGRSVGKLQPPNQAYYLDQGRFLATVAGKVTLWHLHLTPP